MCDFAIGIDLGTTNSCVAIYLNGRAEVLANEVGERITPSFVAYKDEEILIGKIAKLQAHKNIKNTIFDVKRLMGKTYNDSKVQESINHWPFTVANREGHPELQIKFHDKEVLYCPEEISAEILKKLKDVASKRVEAPVTKAVITVPAYFNDSQRQATKEAGKLAGLEVLMLLNEPTAAAITYALDKCSSDCKYALIFDLGGGTFDVSIIKFENRLVTVKAIHGDSHLGGNDFDVQLLNYLVEDIETTFNCKIQNNHRTLAKLRSACEKSKRLLSFQTCIEIDFDAIYDGNDYCIELTRKKFEDLNEVLFNKTIEIVKNCLMTASFTPADIDNVVLVGGSTKIPKIKHLLQELFEGKTLSETVNPDEAVVIGAAIQAANLNKNDSQVVEDFILEDVVPFSLGIETAPDGLMFNVIDRYTLLPATVTKPFTTICDNQIRSNIQIYEGENKFAHDNHLIGSFTLTGFPPAPKGATKIDVTFNIDVNGILTVTATERLTKKTNNITITKDRCLLTKKDLDTLGLSWDTFYQNFSKSRFSEFDY